MKVLKILIVDDEKIARLNIKAQLDDSYTIYEAENLCDAHKIINKEVLDICFIDLNLDSTPKLLGLELIASTVKKGIYPVVMSSHSSDAVIQEAYNLGCKDYYSKGNEEQNVNETINRYFLARDTFTENNLYSELFSTKNEEQKKLYKRLGPIISTDIPICILGETGTGKTFLAESIHKFSRCKGIFVSINCAALNESLLESELFGHSKGAFTGANESKQGKLSLANNGTLHLDEFGSMSLHMQAKLLTALESGEFYPVGSDKKVKSKFRIISSTQDNVEILIRTEKFRFDLYQRLCGFTIRLLPMRERREDILPAIREKISTTRRIVFSTESKEMIENYNWPGNLREIVRFADVISKTGSGIVNVDEVCNFFNKSPDAQNDIITETVYEKIKEIGLSQYIEEVTKAVVEFSLKKNTGAIRKSCTDLKISHNRLYRYFDKESGRFVIPTIQNVQAHINELH